MLLERIHPRGMRILLKCAAALRVQGNWLLDQLAELDAAVLERASKGGKVQVGWVLLNLVKENGQWTVFQPDFNGNPAIDFTDDLSSSLLVMAAHNDLAARTGLPSTPPLFYDKITCESGCLEEPHLLLERQSVSSGDSGWHIGRRTGSADDRRLEAHRVFELLKYRSSIMSVLALPVGCIAILDGDRIEAILNARNERIFPLNPPNSPWTSVVP